MGQCLLPEVSEPREAPFNEMRWLAIAFVAALGGLLGGCEHTPPLPVFGTVPHFSLTDQAGSPFDSSRLSGRVWVAEFMYATCPGPCPLMSHLMRQIAQANQDLQLVSFTVDPEHDTPAVLAAYAKHYPVPAGRWWFLTGSRQELNDLGLNAFHLNKVDGTMEHSTRFALVDEHMRTRAYYETLPDQFRPQLLADVLRLEHSDAD